MTISTKNAKLGYLLIAPILLLPMIYCIVLFEPVQSVYVNYVTTGHEPPSRLLLFLVAIGMGTLLGLLSYLAAVLQSLDKTSDKVITEKITWTEIFSSNLKWWVSGWILGFLIINITWFYTL